MRCIAGPVPVTRFGALALAALLAGFAPIETRTHRVAPGEDLQAAINAARPGDTITLVGGATYTGHFILPAVSGDRFITIRTAAGTDELPPAGQRVVPRDAPALAKLRSPDRQPVVRTAPGAHHWRLQLLEITSDAAGGELVALGSGGADQSDLARVPHHLEIDRCYIHGQAASARKRGIALNSASTTITGSYVADIKSAGQESQAIASWNGPGPYVIENNYLEAAGVNVLFGGGDPAIRDLSARDITFRRNHVAKPVGWRAEKWSVKNLFELKNARDVLVEGNLMEYAWKDAQVGYAVLFTPRNQDGGAPWATVENVTFRGNVVRHAGGGIQITGTDSNHPSGSTRGVRVVDNLFYDISAARWGGPGAFLLVGSGPSAITIQGNTVAQDGNIISAFGGSRDAPEAIRAFVFRDNVVRHNAYGVHGSDRAPGRDTLDAYFPGAVFTGNVIAGGTSSRYPAGNTFIADREFDMRFLLSGAGRGSGVSAATVSDALGSISSRQYQ